MNPLKVFCFVALAIATVSANPNPNKKSSSEHNQSLNPSSWLSPSDLQSIPAVDQITLQNLENMSPEQGAKLVNRVFHLSQINNDLTPSFVPSPSNVPAYIVKPNGQNVQANLNNLVSKIREQPNFGDEEVTIFITGYPQQQSNSVEKANRKLVQAYMERYSGQQQQQQKQPQHQLWGNNEQNQASSSSEEDNKDASNSRRANKGNLVVIDLGATINNFKRYALLDIEQTGAMVAKALVDLTNEVDVPHEIVHLVAQGIGAHVAGSAARQFTRLTGHQLRRITALDPSKILAKNPKSLTGLARGDADFVDAIHTSPYGMGTPQRVGDIDFYPNGPSVSMPGTKNIVESTMRATRYFAESVRPGNERNFPAVAANSLKEYKNNNGYGKRAYMGIAADYDLEGDYVLQVNEKSPFGKSQPAQKQSSYHGIHQSWRNANN